MEYISLLRTFIILSTLATASVTDILMHKVYNRLLLTAAAGTAVLHLLQAPEVDMSAVVPACAFIALLILLHSVRMVGAADVKLYLLIIFAWPDRRAVAVIAWSLALAAAVSALRLARGGLWRKRLHIFTAYIARAAGGGDTAYYDPVRDSGEATIPMAVFILLGAGLGVL